VPIAIADSGFAGVAPVNVRAGEEQVIGRRRIGDDWNRMRFAGIRDRPPGQVAVVGVAVALAYPIGGAGEDFGRNVQVAPDGQFVGEKLIVVLLQHLHADDNLTHIAHAGIRSGFFTSLGKHREEDSRQDRDDGDHDEQFY